MRDRLIAAAILLVAVALCWGDVTIGQARAGAWVVALIGQERAAGDPVLFEAIANVILYGPLIVVGVIGAAIERRNAFAAGRRPLPMFGIGLLIGLAGVSVSALYSRLAGAVVEGEAVTVVAPVMALGVGVVALQTIAEEVFFRGWLQPALARRWGVAAAIVAGSLAFAALHIAGGARAPISLLNLFLGGLMFGLLAARSGGLAGAVGAHLAWNAAEQLLWGLDPNGQDGLWVSSYGSLLNWNLQGSPIWGGTPDGLNDSIGMTVALLAILAPLVALVWRRGPVAGAAMPALAPALNSSALPG